MRSSNFSSSSPRSNSKQAKPSGSNIIASPQTSHTIFIMYISIVQTLAAFTATATLVSGATRPKANEYQDGNWYFHFFSHSSIPHFIAPLSIHSPLLLFSVYSHSSHPCSQPNIELLPQQLRPQRRDHEGHHPLRLLDPRLRHRHCQERPNGWRMTGRRAMVGAAQERD